MPKILNRDKPPAGTRCAPCHAGGHFCQATRWVGKSDVAICEPCAKSVNCPTYQVIALATGKTHPLVILEDIPISPVRTIPREEWPAEEISKVAGPEEHRPGRFGRQKTFTELKRKILSEPASISNTELVKKYGSCVSYIGKIRREAGILSPGALRWDKIHRPPVAAAEVQANG